MKVAPSVMAATADAAWAAALRRGSFTYADIAADVGLSIDRATDLVRGWVRARAAISVGLGPHRRKQFRVTEIGRALSEAPVRSRADGSPIRQATVQGNLWRSMRGLRAFTPVDLAAHSCTETVPVDEVAAQAYCQSLTRAGYLRVERKAVPGRRQAIYRLVRDTGPQPPSERRVRAIWDGNLGKITHIDGVRP